MPLVALILNLLGGAAGGVAGRALAGRIAASAAGRAAGPILSKLPLIGKTGMTGAQFAGGFAGDVAGFGLTSAALGGLSHGEPANIEDVYTNRTPVDPQESSYRQRLIDEATIRDALQMMDIDPEQVLSGGLI